MLSYYVQKTVVNIVYDRFSLKHQSCVTKMRSVFDSHFLDEEIEA
jgi:hypothetical protein